MTVWSILLPPSASSNTEHRGSTVLNLINLIIIQFKKVPYQLSKCFEQ